MALAQIPKLGNDTLLDVATWNVEWLGDPAYGPTNENLQFENVKALINQTDLDVIALQEMSNGNTFFNLSDQLFAKYKSINSTFQATQKMCLYYKASMFELIPSLSQNILLQYADNEFATRPPLQVALKTLGGNKTDTLYFIVVHLKANTGSTQAKQTSYNKRAAAAGLLKTYIEQQLAGKKCIVLGDWNDDLNTSVFNNLTSPYKPLLDAGYTYTTKPLTDAGKSSYVFGGKMIDHIMLSHSMDSLYINNSTQVFNQAGTYISNYSNTTSDHYPVYSFFNWKKITQNPMPANPNTGVPNTTSYTGTIYPNPANGHVYLSNTENVQSVTLYNTAGQAVLQFAPPFQNLNTSSLAEGVYVLKIDADHTTSTAKIVIKH